MPVTVIFQGELVPVTKRSHLATQGEISIPFTRLASIKDMVEALGVPHTEIGLLMVNGKEIAFDYLVKDSDHIEVYPHPWPLDLLKPSLLRPTPIKNIQFVVDKNVAKLASLLRMCGFDASYQPDLPDKEIAEISFREKRILLTKDKGLLQRKIVQYGRLVRSVMPKDQLAEIIEFFGLSKKIKPFIRCLLCNGKLEPVTKDKILDKLEPLTKKYYDRFYICAWCGKIYWPGSHRDNMLKLVRDVQGV